jgi:hypothetical protein
MDADQTIAEIECLERIFAKPDTSTLSASHLTAANRRHDEMLANSRAFAFGSGMVCCPAESLVVQLGEVD